jgi:SagB-type dehydrogenase family enzyme
MDPNAPLFSLFWENSKQNPRLGERLALQIEESNREIERVPTLSYARETPPLPHPSDRLAAIMSQRRSTRSFRDRALSAEQLGSLFFAFARGGGDRDKRLLVPSLPSAGGRYPVEVFAWLLRAESALNGQAVYYHPDTHTLSPVAPAPPWRDHAREFGLECDGEPAVVFAFVAFPERATRRYGERGGRFVLIEVGHYAHSLALRVASEGLGGVLLGGLDDDRARSWLRLERTGAIVTVGYACGVPAEGAPP